MSEAVDQHTLIAKLKDVAIELGRTPTKTEFFRAMSGGQYRVEKHFGSYSALVIAAGLDPAPNSRIKINNSVFEKSVVTHLEHYRKEQEGKSPIQSALISSAQTPSFATISDVHWPFQNDRVLSAFALYVEKHKPEYVILNGDAWDMYSHGKYPRSHNVFTPKEEQDLARRGNEEFWREIQKRSPKSKCVQMLGNHDIRPLKRVLESYPAAEDWIEKILTELFTFANVRTIFDPREELILGNTAIFHGYRSGLGDHRDFTLMNCVNGHTHKGGVVFRQIRGAVLWELNSGLAGDPLAKGLTYTPQKIVNWTPGFGAHDSYGPRFISV